MVSSRSFYRGSKWIQLNECWIILKVLSKNLPNVWDSIFFENGVQVPFELEITLRLQYSLQKSKFRRSRIILKKFSCVGLKQYLKSCQKERKVENWSAFTGCFKKSAASNFWCFEFQKLNATASIRLAESIIRLHLLLLSTLARKMTLNRLLKRFWRIGHFSIKVTRNYLKPLYKLKWWWLFEPYLTT